MQTLIRFNGLKHPDRGEVDYEQVLERSLDRFRHRLKQVQLYLADTNGPRGGVDKQCRCVLHLRRLPPVVIEDRDACLSKLIHRVADRVSHALSRATGRRADQLRRRQGGRRQEFATPNDLLGPEAFSRVADAHS